ncbi:TPA: hypothetical protein DDW35_06215 [Candidatus Sumerlaeota bacterium]|nr:hypothetical protein [Candidatus Sumerlaeota bacterium]
MARRTSIFFPKSPTPPVAPAAEESTDSDLPYVIPPPRQRGCIVDLILRFFYFFFEVLQTLFFSTLIFCLAAAGSYLLVQRYIRGQEIVVPNVAGKTVAEAAKILLDTKTDLSLKIEGFDSSNLVEKDEIVAQNPQPENRVKAGTVVRVRVSLGSKLAACPDVLGKNYLEAGILLRDAGLLEGAKTFVVSPEKNGVVIGQDPPASAQVERQTRVNLLVSAGASGMKALMPSIKDMTVTEANEKLAPLGVQIGDTAGGAMDGVVSEQSPAVGASVAPGDFVRVKLVKKN